MDDDELPKKTPRATIIRRALIAVLVVACVGGWLYSRYGVKKSPLGGPCAFAVHCGFEAPRCLKATADEDGVCSRPCANDGECADGIKCVKVELDERDDRGTPLEGGYCFPQAVLDARKKRSGREAGAPKDSFIDVPEVTGQLEGEIVMRWERGRPDASPTTYLVRGTLVRVAPAPGAAKPTRTIVDASSLRAYDVDDAKKTFTARALEAPGGDAKVEKTGTKERVADRECEIWNVEDGRVRREVCIVAGGAFIDPSARTAASWARELAVRSAFPFRLVERDASGHETARMVVARFEPHAVDATLFSIPRSYKNLAAH